MTPHKCKFCGYDIKCYSFQGCGAHSMYCKDCTIRNGSDLSLYCTCFREDGYSLSVETYFRFYNKFIKINEFNYYELENQYIDLLRKTQ